MGAFFYVIDGEELELRFRLSKVEARLDGQLVATGRWFAGVRLAFNSTSGHAFRVRIRQWFYTTNVAVWKGDRQVVGWRS